MEINPLKRLAQRIGKTLSLPSAVEASASRFEKSKRRFTGGLSQADGVINQSKKNHLKRGKQ